MADLAHVMGGDLSVGPTGDLAVVLGVTETQQRVLRRLLTNPGAYLWQLGYGGGLPGMIGQPAEPNRIAAIIRAQVLQEAAVAPNPPPSVSVTVQPDGTVTASVIYTDALTLQPQTLSFPVR